MKRIWTIILLASAVRAADVTLWMTGQTMMDNPVRYAAMHQVSGMFAGIGVSLEWAKAMPTAPEGVVIEVRYATGLAGYPGSMAFSTPFDPRPVITVLCDRILFFTGQVTPEGRATILAYVLAHEIGHVLMRTNAHSPDGLMKAHWTASDLVRIIHRSLAFLPIDQDTIRSGIASFEVHRDGPQSLSSTSGLRRKLVAHAAGSSAPLEITVQIFNDANTPRPEIRQAQRVAGWMFQKAGIAVRWVECPPLMRERGGDQVCKETDDPSLFVVMINAWDPPEQSDTALGFALLQGRANHAAAVYPRIAAQTAHNPDLRDTFLLGSVMAHELAHLLFRSTRHGEGIMQAAWSRRDYVAMAQRRLTFTAGQAQELRSMLAARIEQAEREPGPAVVVAAIRH